MFRVFPLSICIEGARNNPALDDVATPSSRPVAIVMISPYVKRVLTSTGNIQVESLSNSKTR